MAMHGRRLWWRPEVLVSAPRPIAPERAGLAGWLCAFSFTALLLPALVAWVVEADVAGFASLPHLVATSAALLALPLVVLPPRLFFTLALPLIGVGWAEILHLVEYGDFLSLGAIAAFFETNPAEAGEFAASHAHYAWLSVGFFALYLGAVSLLWRAPFAPSARARLSLLGACAVVFVAGMQPVAGGLGLGSGSLAQHLKRAYPLSLANGVYYFWKETRQLAEAVSSREAFRFDGLAAEPLPGREIVVLVIGETSRARSWGVYGYERDTSPRMSELAQSGSLVAFSDAYSQSTLTRSSVPLILTRATPAEMERLFGERSLLSAFREAGYEVHWISNQEKYGVFNTVISAIAAEADHTEFLSQNRSHRSAKRNDFDEALLPRLQQALDSSAPKLLVVLHTMGSHYDYHYRYPPAFERFRPTRDSEEADAEEHAATERNAYDNSILYTDHFLAGAIERLAAQGAAASLIFVSDHGENLGDEGRDRWGHGLPHPTPWSLHVPLFVWTSEELRAARPDHYAGLVKNRDKAVSLDYLFYTALDLAGIAVEPDLQRTRSLASADLQVRPRMVLTARNEVVDAASLD